MEWVKGEEEKREWEKEVKKQGWALEELKKEQEEMVLEEESREEKDISEDTQKTEKILLFTG